MNASDTIRIAQRNLGRGNMVSSAKLLLEDAIALLAKGEEVHAQRRALKSIAYSVGIFHPDYAIANKD